MQADSSYTYDLAQNRTSMTNNLTQSVTTYTYNALNQMLTAGNVSFAYDANGNTVSKTVNGQTTTFTWDFENKLTRIDDPNGATNTFTTNADGVRMTANDSGGNRRFIYDGTNLIAEQDVVSGNLIAAYDHGNGGLARQMRGTGASYYQFDGLGSTRQLTSANQVVTDTVGYDAWGNVLSSSGTTVNVFKYVGRLGYYADADNGLMLLGARYYSSSVSRFWTVDPSRDGYNWYAYSGNHPVNRVDPSGNDWTDYLPWNWGGPQSAWYWWFRWETWREAYTWENFKRYQAQYWSSWIRPSYWWCVTKCIVFPVAAFTPIDEIIIGVLLTGAVTWIVQKLPVFEPVVKWVNTAFGLVKQVIGYIIRWVTVRIPQYVITGAKFVATRIVVPAVATYCLMDCAERRQ